METKDWVLLLVPIIVDGIIVFLIQTYFSNKYLRQHKYAEFNVNIVKAFQEKTYNLIQLIVEINKKDVTEIFDDLENIRDYFRYEFIPYFFEHREILDFVTKRLEDISEQISIIIIKQGILDIASDRFGAIKELEHQIDVLYNLTLDISNKCDTIIIKSLK